MVDEEPIPRYATPKILEILWIYSYVIFFVLSLAFLQFSCVFLQMQCCIVIYDIYVSSTTCWWVWKATQTGQSYNAQSWARQKCCPEAWKWWRDLSGKQVSITSSGADVVWINTDWFLTTRGVWGACSPRHFLDFNSPKFPFLAFLCFWGIQTGYLLTVQIIFSFQLGKLKVFH